MGILVICKNVLFVFDIYMSHLKFFVMFHHPLLFPNTDSLQNVFEFATFALHMYLLVDADECEWQIRKNGPFSSSLTS
jgi:hypothetical protein